MTVGQKTITDPLHEEGKTKKIAAKKAGCCQGAVSKHTHGKSQFPQSEMVLGTVPPAGVGGLCSIRSEVSAAVYQPI